MTSGRGSPTHISPTISTGGAVRRLWTQPFRAWPLSHLPSRTTQPTLEAGTSPSIDSQNYPRSSSLVANATPSSGCSPASHTTGDPSTRPHSVSTRAPSPGPEPWQPASPTTEHSPPRPGRKRGRERATQEISTPLLVLAGTHGAGTFMTEAALRCSARKEAVLLERCGHYVPEEAPERLVLAVRAFWERAPSDAAG